MERVDLSVVIPVWDEAPSLVALHARLSATLGKLGKSYEVIYVDDGSRDGSAPLLRQLYEQDRTVRVIRFDRNYGQHAAVLAGFERARGEIIVTLDGDLQNPPEEIPKLLEKLHEGYEVVGGWREARRDSVFRRAVSSLINRAISRVVGVHMRDYGCMLRAYRRSVVDQILRCRGTASFIPALANAFAGSVAEVAVAHEPRRAGRSKYGLLRLLRLSFFVGLQILALGLIGEYVARIYKEIRRRPGYVVQEVLE